jgi:hypothetical protein
VAPKSKARKNRVSQQVPRQLLTRSPAKRQEGVELRGIDFASFVALHSPLRFPPPIDEHHDGVVRDWKLLQRLFELQDPRSFATLTEPVPDDAKRTLRRFVANATRLAQATLLRMGARLTVQPPGIQSAEKIELEAPPRELLTSWAVDFRQCYGAGEAAGFRKAFSVLWRLSELEHDAARELRLIELRAWGNAEATMKGNSLDQLAIDLHARRHKWPEPPQNMDPAPPETTIAEYLHGEYLHSDAAKAAIVESRSADKFLDALHRYHFIEATIGLAHVYIGFSVATQRALGERRNP